MSSEPQCHDTGGSYPPGPTSGSCGVEKEQLENTRDTDTGTDSTAASPSHHAQQLDLATGTNNHEHEPQDQERSDGWTVEDLLDIQEERHQGILQEIRAANAEDRILLNEVMGQNISTNLGLGFQRIEEFFTNWSQQFTQHHLASKVASLEERLNLANQTNQKLSEDFKEMRTKHRIACTKLDKALCERDEQRRLADGGALANSTKATDDAVLDKWRILSYNIRTLAYSLAKSPPSQSLDQIALSRLSWISQSHQEEIHDQDYRELLLQGHLWRMVNGKVFNVGPRLWGGPGMAGLKTVQSNLINRLGEKALERSGICQQAARWLAQGSNILDQLWGCEPEGVKALANIETTRLMPFLSPQDVGPNRVDKVKDEISVIIECAVELDQMFMCSKALFRVHWKDQQQSHSKCQRFNLSTMDPLSYENELSSESIVEMVISPFLSKAGNADGQNYESSMLLVKASVVCN
ncbi:hypothetical protein NCS57_00107900 [Fusarium keratoplasticum]|uniref:Uncharacterized protein n=1 Tax=Fusarium keratoplasticum TaxID=1328300 RepID=A0ACC0RDV2_9HYPO|nr:hypothetical protein NCS57_00107900 [Fusarium keratoplasticum]KAI8684418.1 hypothetical protein NCS57_00107900 [Fusarium keratoplasticum]KAI8688531.1 hypothetical protein NCS55_00107000 [Fusarium keratoplasticum]